MRKIAYAVSWRKKSIENIANNLQSSRPATLLTPTRFNSDRAFMFRVPLTAPVFTTFSEMETLLSRISLRLLQAFAAEPDDAVWLLKPEDPAFGKAESISNENLTFGDTRQYIKQSMLHKHIWPNAN
jgi:hypothetical protein